MHLIEVRC